MRLDSLRNRSRNVSVADTLLPVVLSSWKPVPEAVFTPEKRAFFVLFRISDSIGHTVRLSCTRYCRFYPDLSLPVFAVGCHTVRKGQHEN